MARATRDFDGTVVEGFRLNDGSGFVPMWTSSNDEDVRTFNREFKEAVTQTPYLRYWREIEDNISLLAVNGEFFGRPSSESWITAEDICTLRALPSLRHVEDAENFAMAIEVFLSLQLAEDYKATEGLRY